MLRQKKLLVLIVLTLFITAGLYIQNVSPPSKFQERALEKIEPFISESDQVYQILTNLKRSVGLDENQKMQLEQANLMATDLFQWKSAIYNEEWETIPEIEQKFLANMQLFESYENSFLALRDIEREMTMQRNEWMLSHNLAYEDEDFPTSPALFLKENAKILFGVVGVGLIILLFGNLVVTEKEQQTWLTVRTQPIAKWRLIAGKYISVCLMTLLYIGIGILTSIVIPIVHNGLPVLLEYPAVVTSGDTVSIISTGHYLMRAILLFIIASLFTLSLTIFIGLFVRNSFTQYMLTGFVLLIGVFSTLSLDSINAIWNPFRLFLFPQLLEKAPNTSDWWMLIFVASWSLLLLVGAVVMPERTSALFQASSNKRPFANGKVKRKLPPVLQVSLFEWRKMRRNPLFVPVATVLALLLAMDYIFITHQTGLKENEYFESIQEFVEDANVNRIYRSEQSIASFDEEKKKAEEKGDESWIAYYNDPESLQILEERLEGYRDANAKRLEAIDNYQQKQWISFYEYQLALNEEWRDRETVSDYFSPFTYAVSIAEKKWLLERNLRPVLSGDFTPTIFDSYDGDKEFEKYIHDLYKKVENSGLFSLYLNLTDKFYIIPGIIILFLVGIGFASERGKRPTLQLLLTQPVRKRDLFLGKVFTNSIIGIGGFGGFFGLLVFIGTLANRFGDWAHPVLHYDQKWIDDPFSIVDGESSILEGFHLMPLGNYLLETVALLLLVFWFSIVLSIFLSQFIRSKVGVIGTLAATIVAGYIGSHKLLGDFLHLSPFTYFDVARITNGEIAVLAENYQITVMTGSLVLFASIIGLIAIGWWMGSRKDRVPAE
ncbi:ABC transporter permease [Sporosarcina sp. Sa2YVA2]|uniref:ABC transporter permease n=2 Tax=Sporosarcina quadrami TaxID=2762234 RepID=A0ABR8U9T8_9BACL|nr:ABC transporter permease [Sporosarcina quadrami]